MSDENKRYLGDGVYFAFDGYQVELAANGESHTNRIYLEPSVVADLLRALGKHFDRDRLRALIGEP
jgi:hypothetical protein